MANDVRAGVSQDIGLPGMTTPRKKTIANYVLLVAFVALGIALRIAWAFSSNPLIDISLGAGIVLVIAIARTVNVRDSDDD